MGKIDPGISGMRWKNQSPVNLTGFIKADLKPIQFSYQANGSEIIHNGHTVQVNYAEVVRLSSMASSLR